MNKRMKRMAAMATLVALGVMFTGCGSDNASDKTIHIGGTVAVTTQMDPAKEFDGWYAVRYGVGETLFRITNDSNVEPWLAEKGEMVEPQTWKITLKDNLKFSNGEAVTPEKVIVSLKRSAEMNSRANSLKGATFTVEGKSIIVHTEHPVADFLNDLCDPYAVILDVGATKDFANAPIGTGPFKMESFESGKKAVVVKNENYWDGTVKSDRIEFVKIGDQNSMVMALKAGEIDVAQDLNADSVASLSDSKDVKIEKLAQPRVYQLYFNMEKMTDRAVREAIMYGIDKKTIGEKTLKGGVTPTYSSFPDTSEYGESQLAPRKYDPEKAKALLAADGYVDTNGDGILDKDGKPLHVTLSTYKRASVETIATEMQAQLKKLGVDVSIDSHEKPNFYVPGDFEVGFYYVITTPTGDPVAFLRSAYLTDSKGNFGKYSNSMVDNWINQLSTTFDRSTRVKLVNDIQQQVIDDAAMDFIGFNTLHVGMRSNMNGYRVTPNDYYQVTKDISKKK